MSDQIHNSGMKPTKHATSEPLAALLQDELVHLEARRKHLEHQVANGGGAAVSEKLQHLEAEIASLERGLLALHR